MRQRPLLEEQIQKLITKLTLEKRGDVATQFDGIHTVERAIEVGSLDDIIPASSLRERVIQDCTVRQKPKTSTQNLNRTV